MGNSKRKGTPVGSAQLPIGPQPFTKSEMRLVRAICAGEDMGEARLVEDEYEGAVGPVLEVGTWLRIYKVMAVRQVAGLGGTRPHATHAYLADEAIEQQSADRMDPPDTDWSPVYTREDPCWSLDQVFAGLELRHVAETIGEKYMGYVMQNDATDQEEWESDRAAEDLP